MPCQTESGTCYQHSLMPLIWHGADTRETKLLKKKKKKIHTLTATTLTSSDYTFMDLQDVQHNFLKQT